MTAAIQVRAEAWPAIRESIEERWPDVLAAVEQLIAARRSENTRIAYEADWKKWCEFVVEHRIDLKTPGLAATTTFRDEKLTTHGPASVSRLLSSLSFIYGALLAAGMLRTNAFAKAWLPRPEVSDLHKTPAVEDDDVQLLLIDATEGDHTRAGKRDAAIIRLLYDTGLRRASLAGLLRDQFRREGGGLVLVVVLKGGKEGIVRLTPEAEAALAAWLRVAPPSSYVFPMKGKPEEPIALGSINQILTKRAERAGVAGKITPHRFRAAFITTAYDAKVYERDIQASVHHSNAETTRGYDRGSRGDHVFEAVAEHRKQRSIPVPVAEPMTTTDESQVGGRGRTGRSTRPTGATFAELQARAQQIACPRCKAAPRKACRGGTIHRARILAAMEKP